MNLVNLIRDQLTGGVADQLGSIIGEDATKTRAALGAAVPAILSGLTSVGSTPAGASKVKSALDQFSSPSTGDLGSLLGGDTGVLIQKGIGLLTSLLGENSLGTIIAAISKFSGIGGGSAKSLLALALPLIMSAISGKAKGLDANGLMGLLSSQKSNIAAAIPAGFTMPALPSAPPLKISMPDTSAPGLPSWLVPALVLGALALLAYFFWPAARPIEPDAPSDVATVSSGYTKVFNSLTEILGGVKDETTAVVAIPKLEEQKLTLDHLKPMLDKIPVAARGPINAIISSGRTKLKELTDPLLALPIVGEKLKPLIDQIMAALNV
ncbi:DUF937 domain-containing protein [Isosphaeraceae bacterium EP7]